MENKKNKDIKISTDLAIEAAEALSVESDSKKDINEIDGITIETSESEFYGVKIKTTKVKVLNEEGEKKINKPIGSYITVESEAMKENDIQVHEEIIKILSRQLIDLFDLDRHSKVLLIGLGNWNVTPDALGPKVIEKTLVTKHLMEELPKELKNRVRPICAISPGVMGLTGIETGEIAKGISDNIKPDLIIAIDALAARNASRINSTIQVSNTGINPGAGVGNRRMAINEDIIGVPVAAIGVPTVVAAATLINDSLDSLLNTLIRELPKGSDFFNMLEDLQSEEKYNLIKDTLDPYTGNMFVTPKEVDAVIERLSNIIANSLNIFLHPGITKEDINRYMY